MWLPPEVRQCIGYDVRNPNEGWIGRLVALGEGQRLDFKRDPYKEAKGRQDLAVDVATFANSIGGVIVIGVGEDGERAPGDVTWPSLDWYRQILNSWIRPFVVSEVVELVDRGARIHLISVEPSADAPHAIERGGTDLPSFAFPVRTSGSKRWLKEHEIAAAYRKRSADNEELDRRLGSINLRRAKTLHQDFVYKDAVSSPLEVIAVPSVAGRGKLSQESVERAESIVSGARDTLDEILLPRVGPWQRNETARPTAAGAVAACSRSATAVAGIFGIDGSFGISLWLGDTLATDRTYRQSAVLRESEMLIQTLVALGSLGKHLEDVGASGTVRMQFSSPSRNPILIDGRIRAHLEDVGPVMDVPSSEFSDPAALLFHTRSILQHLYAEIGEIGPSWFPEDGRLTPAMIRQVDSASAQLPIEFDDWWISEGYRSDD